MPRRPVHIGSGYHCGSGSGRPPAGAASAAGSTACRRDRGARLEHTGRGQGLLQCHEHSRVRWERRSAGDTGERGGGRELPAPSSAAIVAAARASAAAGTRRGGARRRPRAAGQPTADLFEAFFIDSIDGQGTLLTAHALIAHCSATARANDRSTRGGGAPSTRTQHWHPALPACERQWESPLVATAFWERGSGHHCLLPLLLGKGQCWGGGRALLPLRNSSAGQAAPLHRWPQGTAPPGEEQCVTYRAAVPCSPSRPLLCNRQHCWRGSALVGLVSLVGLVLGPFLFLRDGAHAATDTHAQSLEPTVGGSYAPLPTG